jgi:hypothetical protein
MKMSDDDRNVSPREWRAVREGDTHSAPKTSPNNTPESFIVGVGASGALLAGAAIVFVTLVGLVSFNVWPTAQESSTNGNVELNAATKSGPTKSGPTNSTVVPVTAAAGQLASSTVGGSGGSPGGGNGGGNGGGTKGGKGGDLKGGPVQTPPSTPPTPPSTPTPPSGGSGTAGDGSGGSGGPVNAIKDPTHPVQPTHPSHPHESTPVGDKGKDPGDNSSDDSVGVTGKAPFARPPQTPVPNPGTVTGVLGSQGSDHGRGQQSDSSGDSSPIPDWRGHGSSRSRH